MRCTVVLGSPVRSASCPRLRPPPGSARAPSTAAALVTTCMAPLSGPRPVSAPRPSAAVPSDDPFRAPSRPTGRGRATPVLQSSGVQASTCTRQEFAASECDAADDAAARRERVHAPAPVRGAPGLADGIVDGRRLVRVHCTGWDAFRQLDRADHGPAVVEDLDQLVLPQTPRRRVGGVHAHHPVVVAVHQHAVVLDVVHHRVLAVALRVEAVPGVRGDELQRVLGVQLLGVRTLPRRHVLHERRALRVVRARSA